MINLAAGRRQADVDYNSAVAQTKSKFVSVSVADASRGADVEKAAQIQKGLHKESVRCRGLREDARVPAARAADAAHNPLLPKMEWKPVPRFAPTAAAAVAPAADAAATPAAAGSAVVSVGAANVCAASAAAPPAAAPTP